MRLIGPLIIAYALAAGTVACGGDSDSNPQAIPREDAGGPLDGGTSTDSSTLDPGGEFIAPRAPAVTPEALPVCRVDLDCATGTFCFVNHCVSECSDARACAEGATCSTRGRCEGGPKALDVPGRDEAFRIINPPPRAVLVARDAQVVRLDLDLEGENLPETLTFRAEDGLGQLDAALLREAPIVDGTARIELAYDGAALAAEETRHTLLEIDTQGGLLRFDLNAMPQEGGIYAASIRVASLGNAEVPLEFEIVTSPANATLANATAAFLVLSTAADNLYSPTGASSETEQARPLVYDALLDRWVATFRNDFALPESSGLRNLSAAPQRTLRFELGFEAPTGVFGRVSDRWTGFYDVRSAAGVRDPAPVVFEGELSGERERDGRASDAIVAAQLASVRTERQGLPALDACTDAMFPTTRDPNTGKVTGFSYDNGNGRIYRCESPNQIPPLGEAQHIVDSVYAFQNANINDAQNAQFIRSSCALAVAENALASGTTPDLLQSFFDGDGQTPDGQSFDAFMQDCAQGVDGLCRPKPEVLCARQLLAYAYAEPATNVDDAALLAEAFERVSREVFLGQQLGAFQSDAVLRLMWLKTTDFPPVVTAALRDYVGGLLDAWQSSVLDVQMGVVAGHYDAAGLALLARQVTGDDAIAKRRQLLFEMSQSWRGAVDALALGARRWNELLRGDAERATRTALVTTRTLDLYVMAGIASDLNLRAGAGFANATFAGGLTALARDAQTLALPFSELIYARDGDVVVTQSLDPTSTNFNLLARRGEAANRALEQAEASVGAVITESSERELSTTEVRNRLNNEIDALVDELIGLCGLPTGCTREQVTTDPACRVTVELGRCGYLLQAGADGTEESVGTNVSEAAAAIGAFEASIQGVLIAESELVGLTTRMELAAQSAKAFAIVLEGWNDQRLTSVTEVQDLIDAREGQWTGALAELTADISEQNTLRGQLAADAKADASAWETIARNGVSQDYNASLMALALDKSGSGAAMLGQNLSDKFTAAANALPSFAGTATDSVSKLSRKMLVAPALNKIRVLKVASLALRAGAALADAGRVRGQFYRSIELEGLREADIGDDLLVQAQIADLAAKAELELTTQQVEEFQVDRLIAALRARAEAELAYERDKVELRDRRDRVLGMLVDVGTYDLNLVQAQQAAAQRLLDVAIISDRAELLAARLGDLEIQRNNIVSLIGSPAVVFAWANKLAQAESQLERAKSAMMDWLVAMEYYAVRPFMDQRIQILLARNTYQLAEIAAEMERLTSVCGSNTNALSATVSLSRLLGYTVDRVDEADGATYTPADQFLAALDRADVSVARQTQIGGQRSTPAYWANEDVWAIEFPVDIETFPNLASSCNAKVLSFDIALIGEGLGDARPTVTLVHSGSSRLRSCQPDLNAYVAQFGPEATRFADLTRLRTPSRSISPVASVGGFASGPNLTSGNVTLGGLPLASDYVLIIDRSAGENPDIDWDKLQDIQIRVNFSFQDFFPRGDCQ